MHPLSFPVGKWRILKTVLKNTRHIRWIFFYFKNYFCGTIAPSFFKLSQSRLKSTSATEQCEEVAIAAATPATCPIAIQGA